MSGMDEFVHLGASDVRETQRDCTSAILRLLNNISGGSERLVVFESVILSVAMNQEDPIAFLLGTFEMVCQEIPGALEDRAEFTARKN